MARRMWRIACVVMLVATAACGGKAPPKAQPVAPPLPPPAPPLLAAIPLSGLAVSWPIAVVPADVSALVSEPAPSPARPAGERGRVAEPARLAPESPPVPLETLRLTTPETPDETAATQRVRELLERARHALSDVRYNELTQDARAQYDTVGELIKQAEDALRERNFVFALRVADKAETLARRLGGGSPDSP